MGKYTIDTWIWVLIYAGMALGGLGLAVQRSDAAMGWAMAMAGVALVVAGAVLVWVRSRRSDDP